MEGGNPEEEARWREAEAQRDRQGRRGTKEHPLVWQEVRAN